MNHPDHFEIGEAVTGPLDMPGIVEERSPGYCLVNFAAAGVRQWLPVGMFSHA